MRFIRRKAYLKAISQESDAGIIMEFGIEIRRKAVKRFAIHAHTLTIGVALIVIIAIQSDKTIFDKKSGSAGKNGVGQKVGKKGERKQRERNISAIKTAAHRQLYFADGSGGGKRIA